MRSASARGVAAAALAALATAVPAGGAVLGSAGRPAAAEPPGWVGGAFTDRHRRSRSRSTPLRRTQPEEVVPQQWAEFFAGIPHGSELGSLVTFASPRPARSRRLCGPEALGCYDARELVMPGEPYDGVAPEHVARHEYGHHIAAHRVESAVARRRLGAEAVGDGRAVSARAVGGSTRPFRATTAPTTGSTRGRHSPSRTASSRSRRPVRRSPPGASSTGASIPTGPPCARSSRTSRRPGRVRRRPGRAARFRAGGPRRWLLLASRRPLDGELTAELKLPSGRLDTLELLAPDGHVLARGLWSGTSHAAARLRRLRPAQTLAAGDVGGPAGTLRSDGLPTLTRWRSPPVPQRWRC